MPRLFLFRGFAIYFWVGEDGEPVHVHVSKGKPVQGATKIWLTRNGGVKLAHNGSKLNRRDLSDVMDFILANYTEIRTRWSDCFHGDISFYE